MARHTELQFFIFNKYMYRQEEYNKYLTSKKWHKKRLEIAKLHNYKCEICKKYTPSHFHIHHKTYEHLGNERNNELMFLCEECHVKLHYQQNIAKRNEYNRPKYIICKYCLEKVLVRKFVNSGKTRCPKCNMPMSRPNKYGKIR